MQKLILSLSFIRKITKKGKLQSGTIFICNNCGLSKKCRAINSMKITNVEFNVVLFYLLLNLHKKPGQDC